MVEQVRLQITGKVQGVYFRATVKKWATELKLGGYVHNKSDGSVEVVVQGNQVHLEELIKRCYNSPGAASVAAIETAKEAADTTYSDFSII